MCCYHGYCCKPPTLVEPLGSLDPAVRQSSSEAEAAVEEHFSRDKLARVLRYGGHWRPQELVHWTEAEAAYGGGLADDHRGLSHTCLTSEDEQDDGYDDGHAAQRPQWSQQPPIRPRPHRKTRQQSHYYICGLR